MIQTEGLTRKFGERMAVADLTLEAQEGEILALLGPNGAGKTTTVRLLSCLLAPTAGRAWVAGHEVGQDCQAIREVVGVLTETPGIYQRLSVRRNLEFFAQLYGVQDIPGQVERYLRLLGLWKRRYEPAGILSKGLRQRLALARALVHEPKVLFLDEPTAGLDPESAHEVRELIEELSTEQRTILLCTHNLPEAEQLCDRIALLRTQLIAVGSPEELKARLFGHRVVVTLANPRPEFAALNLPFIKDARLDGQELTVELVDPKRDRPQLVRKLVELGAEIQSVAEEERTLEDVYLELLEGEHEA
jgi:ABC-2 type transport system ATP-binding protein